MQSSVFWGLHHSSFYIGLSLWFHGSIDIDAFSCLAIRKTRFNDEPSGFECIKSIYIYIFFLRIDFLGKKLEKF